jgi:hypothetical protein
MSYRPLTDVWILSRPRVGYYGAYPGGFPERARVLLGASLDDPVLHVCGGKARDYPYRRGFGPNDKTLDLDPNLAPDYLQDARKPYPTGFRAILADPPYTAADADEYWPGRTRLPAVGAILRSALVALPLGGRVGVLHYLWPRPSIAFRCVAVVSVIVGYGNRGRLFSVYEKEAEPRARELSFSG